MARYICPKCNGTAEYTMFGYKCNDCSTIFDSLKYGIYERSTLDYHDWFRNKFGMPQRNWIDQLGDIPEEEKNLQINGTFDEYEAHCLANGITPSHMYTLGKKYTMTPIEE